MIDWEKYGYVRASKYRKKIVLDLYKTPKTPKEIQQNTDLYLSHISSTLSDMQEKEIVVCVTPNLRKGKVFKLTEEGEKIAEEFKRRKGNN